MWPFSETKIEAEQNPDFWRGGVPKHIGAVNPVPALNRPSGSDLYEPHELDSHIRAAYAMIAQLRDRVEELESKLANIKNSG